ncbi:MAG: molybdopterin-dependent oxidoreductase [Nakamurella sp.]
MAARVGLWLGISFTVCFLTGLISHLIQQPPAWFGWPTSPVWLYRVTQGIHVTTGVASIPLLLVKLWTVSPRFWKWPPITSVISAVERLSVFLLVGAAFFELLTGLFNVAEAYLWGFLFPPVHYAVAWVAVGAVAIHVAVKLPVIRRALGGSLDEDGVPSADDEAAPAIADPASPPQTFRGPLSRRGLLGIAFGSAGLAVLVTVGDKIPALSFASVLAQRSGAGPQGLPVNRSAADAGVSSVVLSADYRLTVQGPDGSRDFTVDQLRSMAQTTAELPISCVEGWSRSAVWTGVPLRDLLALVGGTGSGAQMISADPGLYGRSEVPATVAADDRTLVALMLGGEPLDVDHGYPARLIAPNRPGVLQTKWLTRIETV